MAYRAFVAGIVGFWLVMTGLLLRLELSPDQSDLLPVPLAHVFRQVFLHEQNSDLVLWQNRQRLGQFHLRAHRLPVGPGGPINQLTFTGGMSAVIPGMPPQRLQLEISLELDDRQNVTHFSGWAKLQEPKHPDVPSLGFSLEGEPRRNLYRYQVRRGDAVQKEGSGTPMELLDDPDLSILGIDPRPMLAQMGTQQAGTRVTARRSTLQASGEAMEVYLVTIHHAESIESTIQVSQLGQILAVKTFAGYDLLDDSVTP